MRLLLIISCLVAATGYGQRMTDRNTIGWYNGFVNARISDGWSMHGEYQWRRDQTISNWQQSLARVSAGYHVSDRMQLRFGYAWIETFPYGDVPINGYGKDFTEHRIFQSIHLTDAVGKLEWSHRLMLEQRWIGKYASAASATEDGYTFLNRARYMARVQYPLATRFYAAAYDEVMIGFGENIGENIFDQNRLGILLGAKLSPVWRIEAGYLNQIVLLGREIDGRNVIQRNNGVIVNLIATVDFRTPEQPLPTQ